VTVARRLTQFLVAALSAALGTTPAFGAEPSPVPAPTASATASPHATAPASPLPVPSGTPGPAPSGSSAPSAGVTLPPGLSLPGMTGTPGAPQPYALFMKKAEREDGLVAVVKKDDDVYFDLGPEQLDRPFIVAPVLASGLGSEAYAGRIYRSFLLEFKRVGKRILWIDKNADFSAPPNTSAANALAISVTDSVINSTPIVAEDEKRQRVAVSAAFFLTDFENIGRDLGGGQQPIILFGAAQKPGFVVDPAKSYLEKTKTLPKNVELTANLAFSGPAGDLSGAPDGRGVRLRMHYSIVEPPAASAYVPRLADDRVGYFITAQKRFDNDALSTPFLRYIDRWNFNNGPIVYYLTNEIPAEYKAPIRSALLEWNTAFAKIGIPNAVEVRDQPTDPAWDPDDVRYSTVRWITSDRAAFAASGPRVADPRTGEILRVEIVIDGEALRSIKRGYVDQVAARYIAAYDANGLPAPRAQPGLQCHDSEACDDAFQSDSAELTASATVALRANGAGPTATDRFAEGWLHSVVLHESGHNLGLRHNFISATLYPLGDIHDKRFTQTYGIVGSVMGYTPINMSPPGQPQGDYFQSKLGPYDYWAIRYGYSKFPNVRAPGDELKALRGIAQESTRPEYAYATDEDAYGPLAVDPRVATWHLSSDPLAFAKNQFAVYGGLVAKLERSYPRDDRPYYEQRRTFETMMRQYAVAATLASKYVGGVYTSRDHRGQPGGKTPVQPIPRERSRRAFTLLADNIFSHRALNFSPQLIRQLGSNHYLHRGVDTIESPDFPVEEYVGNIQDRVMFALFSPDAMGRLAGGQFIVARGERAMSVDDLFAWTQAAIWDDLGAPVRSIDPLHRALQRRYTNLMVAFALAPSFVLSAIGYPSDTASLARYALRRIDAGIGPALHSGSIDVATRAHLEDVQNRVRHALSANAVRGA